MTTAGCKFLQVAARYHDGVEEQLVLILIYIGSKQE